MDSNRSLQYIENGQGGIGELTLDWSLFHTHTLSVCVVYFQILDGHSVSDCWSAATADESFSVCVREEDNAESVAAKDRRVRLNFNTTGQGFIRAHHVEVKEEEEMERRTAERRENMRKCTWVSAGCLAVLPLVLTTAVTFFACLYLIPHWLSSVRVWAAICFLNSPPHFFLWRFDEAGRQKRTGKVRTGIEIKNKKSKVRKMTKAEDRVERHGRKNGGIRLKAVKENGKRRMMKNYLGNSFPCLSPYCDILNCLHNFTPSGF